METQEAQRRDIEAAAREAAATISDLRGRARRRRRLSTLAWAAVAGIVWGPWAAAGLLVAALLLDQ